MLTSIKIQKVMCVDRTGNHQRFPKVKLIISTLVLLVLI